ncbi:MAG TPA: porin [Kofleriaceae bacterium]|nr:porin [Kofleriaceae bacterium]
MYIPRSRLILDGNAFGSTNRYKLELSLGDKGGFGFIKDLYIDKNLGPFSVRVGQWKRPWERQEIVSDFAIQFNERTAVSDFAGSGRDLGFAIHNRYEQSPEGIEWAFGVFNGFSGGNDRPVTSTTCVQRAAISCTTPLPTNVPGDWSPALVARVGWNSQGIKGYSEGDVEGGGLRYAVAVGYKVDLANFSAGDQASKTDNMSHGLEADALFKLAGFSLEVEGFLMKIKTADAAYGGLAQAGMFVVPKQVEVAAQVAVSPTTGDRKLVENRAAINWYWAGHPWKLASDIARTVQTGRDPTTLAKDHAVYQVRSMVQLTF